MLAALCDQIYESVCAIRNLRCTLECSYCCPDLNTPAEDMTSLIRTFCTSGSVPPRYYSCGILSESLRNMSTTCTDGINGIPDRQTKPTFRFLFQICSEDSLQMKTVHAGTAGSLSEWKYFMLIFHLWYETVCPCTQAFYPAPVRRRIYLSVCRVKCKGFSTNSSVTSAQRQGLFTRHFCTPLTCKCCTGAVVVQQDFSFNLF